LRRFAPAFKKVVYVAVGGACRVFGARFPVSSLFSCCVPFGSLWLAFGSFLPSGRPFALWSAPAPLWVAGSVVRFVAFGRCFPCFRLVLFCCFFFSFFLFFFVLSPCRLRFFLYLSFAVGGSLFPFCALVFLLFFFCRLCPLFLCCLWLFPLFSLLVLRSVFRVLVPVFFLLVFGLRWLPLFLFPLLFPSAVRLVSMLSLVPLFLRLPFFPFRPLVVVVVRSLLALWRWCVLLLRFLPRVGFLFLPLPVLRVCFLPLPRLVAFAVLVLARGLRLLLLSVLAFLFLFGCLLAFLFLRLGVSFRLVAVGLFVSVYVINYVHLFFFFVTFKFLYYVNCIY
jgi:hypothetical protein